MSLLTIVSHSSLRGFWQTSEQMLREKRRKVNEKVKEFEADIARLNEQKMKRLKELNVHLAEFKQLENQLKSE